MRISAILLVLTIAITFAGNATTITAPTDYNHFLNQTSSDEYSSAVKEYQFWKSKYSNATNQYPYLLKMASAQNLMFGHNGNIAHLREATSLYEQANLMVNCSDAAILRALAKNYISEHRFDEALAALTEAKILATGLPATTKMLFDAHMELGNYAKAEQCMKLLAHEQSFDYLIRKAKWADHSGKLEDAIYFMNRALDAAESDDNEVLIQWTTTNLADYYGHAGQIDKSYEHFLKALEIDPSDAYAKKGIAWILYSHERNPTEALRIIDSINDYYYTPDYDLLRAEIAEFIGDDCLVESYMDDYYTHTAKAYGYGNMYNKYNVLLFAQHPVTQQKALSIAESEVLLRPTAQSYSLQAMALYQIGQVDEAKMIINEQVVNQTFEPEPLLIAAEILQDDQSPLLKELKSELEGSLYELGPIAAMTILSL